MLIDAQLRTTTMRHDLIARLALPVTLVAVWTGSALAQPLGAGPGDDGRRILERIVVKVNGEILTQTDLENRQIAAIRGRGEQPGTNAELYQMLADVTPGVIASAVDEMLLAQRGKELGFQLSDDQFREFLDNLQKENNLETDEELAEILDQQEGLTLDDLRRLIERQMLVGQVQQVEILNRVSITDVEAREHYDASIDQFTEPATATLREILIAVPEAASGVNLVADEQARTKAIAVLERLSAGEDFGLVATEVSDSASKTNGGLIGPLQLSQLSESVQKTIGNLEVGDVSEVMPTTQGYQILKLEARTDDAVQPFDDVRETISSSVFNDRRLEEYEKYLNSLRETATIEWKSEELREAYDQFRANPPVALPPPI